jgi:homocysteine S-methyltransferase
MTIPPKITLLDGSIGQELVKLSGKKPSPLWSTSVLMSDPALVSQVHDSYFSAGSTVATTNTYASVPDRLEKANLLNQLEVLTKTAVSLAQKSRDKHGSGKIAGSIGPLEGSYRPWACPPAKVAAKLYQQTVEIKAPSVDVLLIETMSSLNQAEGALMACCCDKNKPVWLAMTVDDDNGSLLRSGEHLKDLHPLVDSYQPEAVLINCSRPEAISSALEIIQKFGKPFGAYANGFTCISEGYKGESATVDALQARQDLDPQAYADYCMEWIHQGATIVGGCCEVGPARIEQVARRIRAAGYEIV